MALFSVTNLQTLYFTDIDFYIGCPKELFYRVALSSKMEEINIEEFMKNFKGNMELMRIGRSSASNDVPMEKV